MICAFVGQKGGSGKSTLAVCVAAELSARGHNVLLIDADPQATAVTWHDVATEAGHTAPTVVAMTGTLHKPNQLPRLATAYDHVIIDTPPRLGDVQRSAMMVADVALLPCGPSAPDAWALAESVKTITEATDYRPQLQAAIVINKKRAGTAAAKGAREALSSTGLQILASEIGLRQPFQEAVAAGLGVAAYAPKDVAAVEIRTLVDELMKVCDGKDEAAA
jgi:chromosome partitioning protein